MEVARGQDSASAVLLAVTMVRAGRVALCNWGRNRQTRAYLADGFPVEDASIFRHPIHHAIPFLDGWLHMVIEMRERPVEAAFILVSLGIGGRQ